MVEQQLDEVCNFHPRLSGHREALRRAIFQCIRHSRHVGHARRNKHLAVTAIERMDAIARAADALLAALSKLDPAWANKVMFGSPTSDYLRCGFDPNVEHRRKQLEDLNEISSRARAEAERFSGLEDGPSRFSSAGIAHSEYPFYMLTVEASVIFAMSGGAVSKTKRTDTRYAKFLRSIQEALPEDCQPNRNGRKSPHVLLSLAQQDLNGGGMIRSLCDQARRVTEHHCGDGMLGN